MSAKLDRNANPTAMLRNIIEAKMISEIVELVTEKALPTYLKHVKANSDMTEETFKAFTESEIAKDLFRAGVTAGLVTIKQFTDSIAAEALAKKAGAGQTPANN